MIIISIRCCTAQNATSKTQWEKGRASTGSELQCSRKAGLFQDIIKIISNLKYTCGKVYLFIYLFIYRC